MLAKCRCNFHWFFFTANSYKPSPHRQGTHLTTIDTKHHWHLHWRLQGVGFRTWRRKCVLMRDIWIFPKVSSYLDVGWIFLLRPTFMRRGCNVPSTVAKLNEDSNYGNLRRHAKWTHNQWVEVGAAEPNTKRGVWTSDILLPVYKQDPGRIKRKQRTETLCRKFLSPIPSYPSSLPPPR